MPVRWEVAHDERFAQRRRARRRPRARPTPRTACTSTCAGSSPAASTSTASSPTATASPVGRTRTAPAPRRRTGRVRFAFASCQDYEDGYYTAHRHLADEDVDVVLWLGDYIYEGGAGTGRAPARGPRAARPRRVPPALRDVQGRRRRSRPRTPRTRGSSRGTTTRSTTTTPATWSQRDEQPVDGFLRAPGRGLPGVVGAPAGPAPRPDRARLPHLPAARVRRPRERCTCSTRASTGRTSRAAARSTSAALRRAGRARRDAARCRRRSGGSSTGCGARSARWDVVANQVMLAPGQLLGRPREPDRELRPVGRLPGRAAEVHRGARRRCRGTRSSSPATSTRAG